MDGHVAIVTGGASGIGKAAALAFAQAGAKVVVADIQDGAPVVAAIEAAGGEAFYQHTAVDDADSVAAMVAETLARYGRLDHAFNNAGIEGTPAPTAECTQDNWQRTIDVNLKGVWQCMKEELPHMTDGGSIVNCSSVAGLVGLAGIPAYSASKHGVIGLTRTAAIEAAPSGIRVNAVCPGAIKTPMLDRFLGDDEQQIQGMQAQHPLGRFGEPEEVAAAAVWLCSDAASFITGQALAVDGGWTA